MSIVLVVDAKVKPKSIKIIGKGEFELVLTNVQVVRGDPVDLFRLDGEHLRVHLCDMEHQPPQSDVSQIRMFNSSGGVVDGVKDGNGNPIKPDKTEPKTEAEEIDIHCWCQVCKNFEFQKAEEEGDIEKWNCRFPQRWLECGRCDGIQCPDGMKCPHYVPDQEKIDELKKQQEETGQEATITEQTETLDESETAAGEIQDDEDDPGEVPDTSGMTRRKKIIETSPTVVEWKRKYNGPG